MGIRCRSAQTKLDNIHVDRTIISQIIVCYDASVVVSLCLEHGLSFIAFHAECFGAYINHY